MVQLPDNSYTNTAPTYLANSCQGNCGSSFASSVSWISTFHARFQLANGQDAALPSTSLAFTMRLSCPGGTYALLEYVRLVRFCLAFPLRSGEFSGFSFTRVFHFTLPFLVAFPMCGATFSTQRAL